MPEGGTGRCMDTVSKPKLSLNVFDQSRFDVTVVASCVDSAQGGGRQSCAMRANNAFDLLLALTNTYQPAPSVL
jgi:hypothetical protein